MDPRLIRKVRRRDRIANWVITGGGLFVIVCVVGILVLIAQVAIPLFLPPSFSPLAGFDPGAPTPPRPVLAIGVDEYLETAYRLDSQGKVDFFDAKTGRALDSAKLQPPGGGPPRVTRAASHGKLAHTLVWSNGGIALIRVEFRPSFSEDGTRTILHQVNTLATLPPRPDRETPLLASARFQEDTGATFALLLPGQRITVVRQGQGGGLLGGDEPRTVAVDLDTGLPGQVTTLLLDNTGQMLFAGTDNGHLLRWELTELMEAEEARLLERVAAFGDGRAITALSMLLGGFTLAVGDARGGVSGWFPVPQGEAGEKALGLVHRLRPHGGPVTALLPSLRTKTMASVSQAEGLRFDQFTNERHLGGFAPGEDVRLAAYAPRGNAMIVLDAAGRITLWRVEIPHPEVSWGGYFGRVWYESYPEPAFVWQSSAASDDFEPKLSIIPLVIGTLKGTFYGMLFAVPLGVMGAMYTSSLMHPRLRGTIKPVFEIMGSVPTVVVGFLAALWLAPIVKASLTAMLLALGFLPLMAIAAMALAQWINTLFPRGHVLRGYEFVLLLPGAMLCAALAYLAGAALDGLFFQGELASWLFEGLGIRFDQRNSVVIAAALGFAVLPTIFTLSDDALTNVPRNLTAASLALGASRWQTVRRVVLPSASPGIFAALMVGLGRAVGETMIVLMATGNTPILDWSPFNGMRTLAANIAVEIPEAPEGGTLYRTLFLTAVLLFLTTFVLNSAAEVVRQRLRRKFGQY